MTEGTSQRKRLHTWSLPKAGRSEPLLVLGASFLLGVAAGCWAAYQMGEGSAQALREYLSGYLAVLQSETGGTAWAELLWRTVRLPLAAALLGLCPLGLPGLPALVGIRGFLFSFVISACGSCVGAKGILAAFLLFGFSQAASTAALLLIAFSGWGNARGLALGRVRRKREFDWRRYLLWCACCTVASAVVSTLSRVLSSHLAALVSGWLLV